MRELVVKLDKLATPIGRVRDTQPTNEAGSFCNTKAGGKPGEAVSTGCVTMFCWQAENKPDTAKG